MTPKEFREIRLQLGLTQPACADLLGKKTRMIQYYESGMKPIPVLVEKYLLSLQKLRDF
jgi:DNA-binding transcriptional regulator YiaG